MEITSEKVMFVLNNLCDLIGIEMLTRTIIYIILQKHLDSLPSNILIYIEDTCQKVISLLQNNLHNNKQFATNFVWMN